MSDPPEAAAASQAGADVSEALLARLDTDENVERVADKPFFGVLTFDSGARLGFTIGSDDAARAEWAMVEEGKLTAFDPVHAIQFVQLIETPRSEVDDGIEKGAAELGLPVESVLFSLPVVELVRAMLEKDRPHYSRLCLMWLLPSELRALRPEILALVDNELLPRQLRDLAGRLVVPE